ncbi:unnamed protein product [Mytilus edulis]|uniref:Uncharacterized protein n=1 Tax=Mytilus edulis TaxID=6550 RepID=A0A8S3VGV3_MYTED|nr:unnamed protein product [Mytilus edulis]
MAGAAEVATEKRFPSLNNEEIKKILIEKDSKNTRRSTDSSVHVHVSRKKSTIEKLKKDNELLRSNKEKDLNTVKKDLEKRNLELQNQLAQIRKSKTESDMDNEKLVFLIDNAKTDAEEEKKANLKNESAEEAFCKYTDLIQKALEKSELVVISLVLPSQIERLNVKIREFNERILYKYDTADKIKVCRNSNFISNGNVVKKFYWDSFRLNKFEGVRVLAGNIRNTLFPRTRNQVPHSQNNQYANSYRESQKDTISNRNDYKYPYNTPNRKNSNRSDQGRNSEAPAGNTYQGPPNTYYDRKLADSIASAVASVFHQYHEFGS